MLVLNPRTPFYPMLHHSRQPFPELASYTGLQTVCKSAKALAAVHPSSCSVVYTPPPFIHFTLVSSGIVKLQFLSIKKCLTSKFTYIAYTTVKVGIHLMSVPGNVIIYSHCSLQTTVNPPHWIESYNLHLVWYWISGAFNRMRYPSWK